MSLHTLYLPDADFTLAHVRISGDEAAHAVRVKRTHAGDTVRLFNGRGGVALAQVASAGRDLDLRIVERRHVPPVRPRVEVGGATPKGPRLDEMIDQLSQVGAASWCPLDTALGIVDPGAHKIERAGRIAVESAKQCGRAWLMEIIPPTTLEQALKPAGATILIADIRGSAVPPVRAGTVRILIGPEGGFTQGEYDAAIAGGAVPVALGPHILRIETAAVVAAAMIMAASGAAAGSGG